jgi:hypothetical protein
LTSETPDIQAAAGTHVDGTVRRIRVYRRESFSRAGNGNDRISNGEGELERTFVRIYRKSQGIEAWGHVDRRIDIRNHVRLYYSSTQCAFVRRRLAQASSRSKSGWSAVSLTYNTNGSAAAAGVEKIRLPKAAAANAGNSRAEGNWHRSVAASAETVEP